MVLDQSRLNIVDKSRSSRLPWRGQFSPELIEYLMSTVCAGSETYLDPFCGSGTVIFEAMRNGKPGIGLEVNPAAWHLAALSRFASVANSDRPNIIRELKKLSTITRSVGFARHGERDLPLKIVNSPDEAPFLRLAVAAAIILGMGNDRERKEDYFARGALAVLSVLNELMDKNTAADCLLNDARNIPFADASVDAVITSPPYVNVFNYHQNYRPATELLGWHPLEAARSEIGANRKHRSNRFLTVIQYCLDMLACLKELSRVMRTDAPLVIVLGRTSNVLGGSFRNGEIVRDLIVSSGAFEELHRAERVFTNRFGSRIFEDVLIARRIRSFSGDESHARIIASRALSDVESVVPDRNRPALREAIERAAEVVQSPMLKLTAPKTFLAKQEAVYTTCKLHA